MPEKDTISNKEAIEMMLRCKSEIMNLRAQTDRLSPKADAYDKLAIVLGLLQEATQPRRLIRRADAGLSGSHWD